MLLHSEQYLRVRHVYSQLHDATIRFTCEALTLFEGTLQPPTPCKAAEECSTPWRGLAGSLNCIHKRRSSCMIPYEYLSHAEPTYLCLSVQCANSPPTTVLNSLVVAHTVA